MAGVPRMQKSPPDVILKLRTRMGQLMAQGISVYEICGQLREDGFRRPDGAPFQLKQIQGHYRQNRLGEKVYGRASLGASTTTADDSVALAQLVLGSALTASQKQSMLQAMFASK